MTVLRPAAVCFATLCISSLMTGCITSERQDRLQTSIGGMESRIQDLQASVGKLQKQVMTRDQQLQNTTQTTVNSQGVLQELQTQLQMAQGELGEFQARLKRLETTSGSVKMSEQEDSSPGKRIQNLERQVSYLILLSEIERNTARKGPLPSGIKTYADALRVLKNQYDSGNYQQLITVATGIMGAAAATDTMLALATEYRAEAKFQLQDYKGAAVDFASYILFHPGGLRYSRALLLGGDSYVYLKNHEAARSYYTECVSLFENTPEGQAASARLEGLDGLVGGENSSPPKSSPNSSSEVSNGPHAFLTPSYKKG